MEKSCLFFLLFLLIQVYNTFGDNSILINEVVSINSTSLIDEENDNPDWIELFNYSTKPLSTKGMRISDKRDYLKAWALADTIINAKKGLTIFASGKSRNSSGNLIIESSGIGIFQHALPDSYRFEYLEHNGNFDLIVNFRNFLATGVFDHSGLIVRQDLDPLSKFAGVFVTNLNRDVYTYHSRDTSGNSYPICKYSRQMIDPPDMWLGVSRYGDTVTCKILDNGFFCLDSMKFNFAGIKKVYIGIASASTDQTKISTSVIGKIILNGNVQPYHRLKVFETNCGIRGNHYISNQMHTDFKLDNDSDSLFLWDASGNLIDSMLIPALKPDISYGRNPSNPSDYIFFKNTTPSRLNSKGFSGIASEPKIIPDGGNYQTSPVHVNLSSADSLTELFYSTDGSEPDSLSLKFNGKPILINKNSVLRVKAKRADHIDNESTSTFFINEPTTLDCISLFADSSSIFDEKNGLLSPKNIFNEIRIPIGFHYYEKGKLLINSGGMLKRHGSTPALTLPQPSLRLNSGNQFNTSKYNYDFFRNGINKHDKLVFRNNGNDWKGAFLRDAFAWVLTKDLVDIDASAYKPVSLFINGNYYGLYDLRERIDEQRLATRYNIAEDHISLIENDTRVMHGSIDRFDKMYNKILSTNMEEPVAYKVIDSLIDINNIINYTLTELYYSNFDWPHNNLKFWSSPETGNKWRWILYDLDWSYAIGHDLFARNSIIHNFFHEEPQVIVRHPYAAMFKKLMENQRFMQLFLNRTADFLNSHYYPERVERLIDSTAKVIEPEIPLHRTIWSESCPEWYEHLDRMKQYANERPMRMREELVDALDLEGISNLSLRSVPEDACSIQINTIDKISLPWDGHYFKGIPISISVKPADGYKFKGWSCSESKELTIEYLPGDSSDITIFFDSPQPSDFEAVINEIMYKPQDENDTKDWIEIVNPGGKSSDLSHWKICDSESDHIFELPEKSILGPGEYMVVCSDTALFRKYFPEVKLITGNIQFGFGEADMVKLIDNNGYLIDSVSYMSSPPWYPDAYGSGNSLELKNPVLNNTKPQNWQVSYEKWGTPGRMNSVYVSKEDNITNETANFDIYPQPVSDYLNLRFILATTTSVEIEIINSIGEVIYHSLESSPVEGTAGHRINCSEYSSGIYFCRISSMDGSLNLSKPFIINR